MMLVITCLNSAALDCPAENKLHMARDCLTHFLYSPRAQWWVSLVVWLLSWVGDGSTIQMWEGSKALPCNVHPSRPRL